MRSEFGIKKLTEEDAGADPAALLVGWYKEAVQSHEIDPMAMTLATFDIKTQLPNARIVYAREVTDSGDIYFYTNYQSQKGKELLYHPFASGLFFWPTLERQVRTRGRIRKIEAELSDAYFTTRPRESQIGAWVSKQSEKIMDVDELHINIQALTQQFIDQEVPRPLYWGGYALVPEYYEFWQGRPARIHDRIIFEKTPTGWSRSRLMP